METSHSNASGTSPSGPTRRTFLEGAAAGALLAAGAMAGAAEAPAASTAAAGVPMVTIAGHTIPRMIIGSNQIGGWSHGSPNLARATVDYFTTDKIVAFFRDCEARGLDVCHTFTGDRPLAALKQCWDAGSKMRPYFLSTLESSGTLTRELLAYRPLWNIHHGNVTDDLFRAGKQEQVHDFIKKVHDVQGIPAGMSCHNPDCIRYAEEKGWEADLYQCSLYYVTRPHEEIRAKLGAVPLGESFLDTDRDTMLSVVRQTKKPCIVFKLLGAGRLTESDEQIDEQFRATFAGIKKSDVVIIGMWPKYKDELSQDVALVRKHSHLSV